MMQTLLGPEAPLHRFTVVEYLTMAEAGLLGSERKVELIEGVIVQKMTQNPPHMIACSLLLDALKACLPPGWFLSMQGPIEMEGSLPEPDAAVVRGASREYLSRRWGSEDLGLIIEVSDSSLAFDQGTKRRVYAQSGIPVYWIVNLVARQIEVYTDPTGPADGPTYRKEQSFLPGQRVPLILDGKTVADVAASDILP